MKKRGVLHQIKCNRVLLVKKEEQRTVIVTDGEGVDRQIHCFCSLRSVSKVLDEDKFICVHQSFIFNIDHIIRFEKRTVVIDDGSEIFLGKNSYYRVRKAFKAMRIENAKRDEDDI